MAEPPIKSRLESRELTNHPPAIQERLNACLRSDAAHIAPGQKGGEHVTAIQKALSTIRRRMPGLGLPEIKDRAGEYGPDTTAAARRYKSINGIIRSGQPLDAIVGRMTLTRLDDELVNTATAPSPKPVVIAAPVEIATLDDDLTKDDLTFKPVPPAQLSGKQLRLVGDMRQKSTSELERLMRIELDKGGKFGSIFLNAFVANSTPPSADFTITHGAGSDFSSLVAGTQVFKAHAAAFRAKLDKEIKELGRSGPFEATRLKDRVPPPRPSWSPRGGERLQVGGTLFLLGPEFQSEQARMLVLIGSFQGARVFLHEFVMDPVTRDYSGTLFYQLIDHFGVDTDDMTFDGRGHGTDGQVAFWVLQHERHAAPAGHMPFRLKVVIQEQIAGSF
jgi:hypothetical protein